MPNFGYDNSLSNNTEITLTWTEPSGSLTGGSTILDYQIQIWDSVSSAWVNEASLIDPVSSFAADNLTPGVTYSF